MTGSGLVEFLQARLSDAQRAAEAATPGPWRVDDADYAESITAGHVAVVAGGRWGGEASVFDSTADALFIAANDPAYVLADVAAKRRIIEEFGSQCGDYYPPGTQDRVEAERRVAERGGEFYPHWPETYRPFCDGCAAAQSADNDHLQVLKLLALPFKDHPDWQEDWNV